MYKYHFVSECFDFNAIMDNLDSNFLNVVFANLLSASSTASCQKQPMRASLQGT